MPLKTKKALRNTTSNLQHIPICGGLWTCTIIPVELLYKNNFQQFVPPHPQPNGQHESAGSTLRKPDSSSTKHATPIVVPRGRWRVASDPPLTILNSTLTAFPGVRHQLLFPLPKANTGTHRIPRRTIVTASKPAGVNHPQLAR